MGRRCRRKLLDCAQMDHSYKCAVTTDSLRRCAAHTDVEAAIINRLISTGDWPAGRPGTASEGLTDRFTAPPVRAPEALSDLQVICFFR